MHITDIRVSNHPNSGRVVPTLLENLHPWVGDKKPDFEDFPNKTPGLLRIWLSKTLILKFFDNKKGYFHHWQIQTQQMWWNTVNFTQLIGVLVCNYENLLHDNVFFSKPRQRTKLWLIFGLSSHQKLTEKLHFLGLQIPKSAPPPHKPKHSPLPYLPLFREGWWLDTLRYSISRLML